MHPDTVFKRPVGVEIIYEIYADISCTWLYHDFKKSFLEQLAVSQEPAKKLQSLIDASDNPTETLIIVDCLLYQFWALRQ